MEKTSKPFQEEEFSEPFQVQGGMSGMLSLFLFVLAVELIMEETTKSTGKRIKKSGHFGNNWMIEFCRHLALLSQTQPHKAQAKIEHVNLLIQPGKRTILKMSMTPNLEVLVANKAFREVDSSTYRFLGRILDREEGTGADGKARIGKEKEAFRQLSIVWKATYISLQTKTHLFI